MRKIILLLLLLPVVAIGQSYNSSADFKIWGVTSIGKGDNSPTSLSAILELGRPGTNRGLLLPRVFDTTSIPNPSFGLAAYFIYHRCIGVYDGGEWKLLSVTSVAGRTGDVVIDSGDIAGFYTKVRGLISAGFPLVYNKVAGSLTHANSGVTAGTYNNVTVNTTGHITSGSNVAYLTGNQTINLSGDVTGSGTTAISTTLKSIGTPGTYMKVTTDAQGRVTSGTALSASDVPAGSGNYIQNQSVVDQPASSRISGDFIANKLHSYSPTGSVDFTLHTSNGYSDGTANRRWGLGKLNTEAAGNVGNDFAITRFDNSGSPISAATPPFKITRSTGEVTLGTINNESTNVDRFLVSSAGAIRYRTGAQLLSDIGAASSTLPLSSVLANGNTSGNSSIVFNKTLSAANKLFDFQQGYGLWSDDIGAIGGSSRLWLDAPALGDFVIGPRSGATVLSGILLKTDSLRLSGTANKWVGMGLLGTDARGNVIDNSSAFIKNQSSSAQMANINITGSASVGSGINLTNATSNFISYPSNGLGAPSFTTRSAGTRMVLWPNLSTAAVDYGIGIGNPFMWFSVPQQTNSYSFRWFGGTSQIGRLDGLGSMELTGQGRFSGWYSANGTGPAAEVGYSSGYALLYGYDRTASSYIPVRIAGGNSAVNFKFFDIDGTGYRFNGLTNAGLLGTDASGYLTDYSANFIKNGTSVQTAQFSINGTGNAGQFTAPYIANGSSTGSVNILGGLAGAGGFRGAEIALRGGTYATTPGEMTFHTGTGGSNIQQPERMRINASGKVGVGTSSPAAQLEVSGGVGADPVPGTFAGAFGITNSTNLYGINFGVKGTGDGFMQAQRKDGTGTLYSILLNPIGGNVGINTTTSPTSTLYVAGTFTTTGSATFANGTTSINGLGQLYVGATLSVSGPSNFSGEVTASGGVKAKSFSLKTGISDATTGMANFSATQSTVTINTTAVTANSLIFLTINGFSAAQPAAPYIANKLAGTSFEIRLDKPSGVTAQVAWMIIEPY